MKLEAQICIRAVIPFNADVGELDLTKYMGEVDGRERIVDTEQYEADMEKIQQQRRDAVEHAETELIAKIEAVVGKHGEIIHVQVEEVRDREST